MVKSNTATLSLEYIPLLSGCLSGFGELESILYIECKDGFIRFNIGSNIGVLDSKFPVSGNACFSIGVDSRKFITVSKKFYDSDLIFKVTKSHLNTIQDNMSASFVLAVGHPTTIHYDWANFAKVDLDVLPAIKNCARTVGNKFLFSGILLDNMEDEAKICSFSHGAIRIVHVNKFPNNISRVAIPMKVVDTIFHMSKHISSIFISEDKILLFATDAVLVVLPTSYDDFPHGYHKQIQLNSVSPKYVFDREGLFYAVDSVTSIYDKDEHFLGFRNVGDSGGKSVWSIEAETSNKHSMSEKVVCLENSRPEPTFFKLGYKYVSNVLKSIKSESINFMDSPSMVCITDETGKDKSYLVKVYG